MTDERTTNPTQDRHHGRRGPHREEARRARSVPGGHLRRGPRSPHPPWGGPRGHRTLLPLRGPAGPGERQPQPLPHRPGSHRLRGAGPRLHQRHLRQRRAGGPDGSARRRPAEGRADDPEVHRRRQHRRPVPRGDLSPDDDGRPHPGPQQALLRRDARAGGEPRAALRPGLLPDPLRHRPLQERSTTPTAISQGMRSSGSSATSCARACAATTSSRASEARSSASSPRRSPSPGRWTSRGSSTGWWTTPPFEFESTRMDVTISCGVATWAPPFESGNRDRAGCRRGSVRSQAHRPQTASASTRADFAGPCGLREPNAQRAAWRRRSRNSSTSARAMTRGRAPLGRP